MGPKKLKVLTIPLRSQAPGTTATAAGKTAPTPLGALLLHGGGVSAAMQHNEAHVAEKRCEPFEEGIYFLEAQLTPLLVSKPVSLRLQ